MAKEELHQLLRVWELAYKTYHDYKDQFYTRLMNPAPNEERGTTQKLFVRCGMNGDVIARANKVLDKKELAMIAQLEERERSLRSAWEQALH